MKLRNLKQLHPLFAQLLGLFTRRLPKSAFQRLNALGYSTNFFNDRPILDNAELGKMGC